MDQGGGSGVREDLFLQQRHGLILVGQALGKFNEDLDTDVCDGDNEGDADITMDNILGDAHDDTWEQDETTNDPDRPSSAAEVGN